MREAHGLPQTSQVHIIVPLAATGSFLAFRLATHTHTHTLAPNKQVAVACRLQQNMSAIHFTLAMLTLPPLYSGGFYKGNSQIDLPINITTISNSVCLSDTSYSTYLASSASLRTKVQSEWGA